MTPRKVTLATGGEARLRNEGAALAAVLANGGTAKQVPGTWSATSELLAIGARPAAPGDRVRRGALPREELECPRVVHGGRRGGPRSHGEPRRPAGDPDRFLDGRRGLDRRRRARDRDRRPRPRAMDSGRARPPWARGQAARRRPRRLGPLAARDSRGEPRQLAQGLPACRGARRRRHLHAPRAWAPRRCRPAPLRGARASAEMARLGRPRRPRALALRGRRLRRRDRLRRRAGGARAADPRGLERPCGRPGAPERPRSSSCRTTTRSPIRSSSERPSTAPSGFSPSRSSGRTASSVACSTGWEGFPCAAAAATSTRWPPQRMRCVPAPWLRSSPRGRCSEATGAPGTAVPRGSRLPPGRRSSPCGSSAPTVRSGPGRALPRRARVRVVVGEPIRVEPAPATIAAAKELTARVRATIESLA